MPLYRLAALVSLVLYPLFSLLPKLAATHGHSEGTPVGLWVPLIVLILLRYAAMVVGLASLQIMSNDMVKPEERALINGLGQSVGSFARAVGPSLGGFTWSWSLGNSLIAPFDFHASFVLLALISSAQFISSLALPNQQELDAEHKRWKSMPGQDSRRPGQV
ncbi:hypothetical protein D7B24_006860 [Verticillium nonalfalfae]|uniref:Major facilitator superfamily (MFS) profile domain-containing protein n=1 Tax=Verticillium nonalfalfae TaxID=1051616 RepID=A0A3M9Y914_9PEZI|nr:uncharacterized protein D7B24_006860 [Verticillium nonalfalfae]RNJ56844.1 hypothetical protein D7B24_006860 [Verticillium nonalfalfae]